jgi:hypothetical protein
LFIKRSLDRSPLLHNKQQIAKRDGCDEIKIIPAVYCVDKDSSRHEALNNA